MSSLLCVQVGKRRRFTGPESHRKSITPSEGVVQVTVGCLIFRL